MYVNINVIFVFYTIKQTSNSTFHTFILKLKVLVFFLQVSHNYTPIFVQFPMQILDMSVCFKLVTDYSLFPHTAQKPWSEIASKSILNSTNFVAAGQLLSISNWEPTKN